MLETKAGLPAKLDFTLYDEDGVVIPDGDIVSLSYSVHDVTNDTEVRAATSITPVGSGTIELTALDTAINGDGSREKRRVCLTANTDSFWDQYNFFVVGSPCEV